MPCIGPCWLTASGWSFTMMLSFDVTFSPDGTRIATASQIKPARYGMQKTGQLLLTLTGHTD